MEDSSHASQYVSKENRADFQIERVVELVASKTAYIDKDFTFIYVSAGYARELHITPCSAKNRFAQEVLGDESFSKLLPYFRKALNGKRSRVVTSINTPAIAKDFEILLVPDVKENSVVDGFVMQLREPIAKYRLDKHLQDHLGSAAVGVHWVDKEGIIIWANTTELSLLGYEKSEYIGQHISKFYSDKKAIEEILIKLQRKETINNYEVSLRHKDGSVKSVLLNSNVVWKKGKFIHTRCFTIDITAQKKVEQARRTLEFHYKEVLESLPAAVYTCDADGKVELYNQAAAVLWGRQPVIGTDLWCGSWKIFSVDDGRPVPLDECPMAETLKTGKPVYGRLIIVERPDKTRRIVAPHPRPIYDQNGNLAGAANMLIDVTDQKRAADVLRASEEKFRLICDLVPTIIWMADVNGQVTYLNKRWTELTGKEPAESYGSRWIEFVHPEDKTKTYQLVMDAVNRKQPFMVKFRHLTQGGGHALMLSIGAPYFNEGGHLMGFIGIIQDVDKEEKARRELEDLIRERTKQLAQTNEELKKSQQRYHRMIDEVQDYAIILLNRHGIVEHWNQGAEKIKGYQEEEIIGSHFRVFYQQQDQTNSIPELYLDEAARTGRSSHEGWRVRKNGSTFWGSVVLTALHNEEGDLIGFSKLTRDLTERKLAHDALVEQNQRLERMNQELLTFAFVSSHDLQEPLRKIQVFSDRILDTDGENLTIKSKEYFNIVQASAGRMRLLIEDVLAYSNSSIEEKKFVPTELNVIVNEVLAELKSHIAEKGAQIERCSLPTLQVIPFQFRQLIYNILANSLKFCRKEIPPHIKLTHQIVAAGELPFPAEAKQYHQISISDNGIGFDQDYRFKIFEVFQRLHTKSEFEGTGVGLAICKKIVENHGGVITAVGNLGAGATFHVYLPDLPGLEQPQLITSSGTGG